MLIETRVHASIEEVARAEKINASYVGRVLRLTLLTPEIIEAILEGRQPVGMTMAGLLTPFSLVWAEQQGSFAFTDPHPESAMRPRQPHSIR
jgi:hypothetical protein